MLSKAFEYALPYIVKFIFDLLEKNLLDDKGRVVAKKIKKKEPLTVEDKEEIHRSINKMSGSFI